MFIGMLDKRADRPYHVSMDTFPTNIREMTELFPDDAACAKYLEAVRWPEGGTVDDVISINLDFGMSEYVYSPEVILYINTGTSL